MSLLPFPSTTADSALSQDKAVIPAAPQTLEETGLPNTFLVELVAKTMFQLGLTTLSELTAQLRLPGSVIEGICQFMRRELMLEVMRRGQNEADIEYELTQAGRARALDWLARSSYVGAAPVTLEAYTAQVVEQSVTKRAIGIQQVREAFADQVIPGNLLDQLGTAVNSGRPMLLYGPAGSGKTYLAELLHRLVSGTIAIPYAIYVHGEVIRLFDEQYHTPVADPTAPQAALDNRARTDARWVMCERPCVVAGGELTLEMLDLSFDGRAGYYEAPPHFKANNGLFVVDDLGRQVITPRALMNRWVVPMDRRHDHLMLRNGGKFTIPFDMVLVFASNLRPAQLEDAAFLRRLGHKISIDAVSTDEYKLIFQRACAAEGIAFDDQALQSLLKNYHSRYGRPLLACYPRDLLHLISSRARFMGVPAELSAELLDWAWQTYFGNEALIEAVPEPGSPI